MKIDQVAAQLYTLRDHLKTSADIAATLRRVREIGYPAVQVSGLGAYEDLELRRILDGEGLVCCATHEPGDRLLGAPGEVAEHLKRLNCDCTAFPHPGKRALATVDEVKAFAAELNAAGKVLHEAGITLSYHNHHVEFRRVGGRTILEILYEETDPLYLQAELDTYWVQYGGGNPVTWCRRMKGRSPVLHLKDFKITAENKIDFAEIGNGNLAWPEIIAAADEAGTRWFAVEQDTCPGDPFDSMRQSFEFIRDELVSK